MATVHDVAAYILEREGPMSAMKLQKLVYYAKAWHLVWEERPLFDARIEAWANGPVVVDLYRRHRGQFSLSEWEGDSSELDEGEKESVDIVLDYYAKKSAHQLSELTHRENPWREARGSLPPGARSNQEITDDALFEYYDGLTSASSE